MFPRCNLARKSTLNLCSSKLSLQTARMTVLCQQLQQIWADQSVQSDRSGLQISPCNSTATNGLDRGQEGLVRSLVVTLCSICFTCSVSYCNHFIGTFLLCLPTAAMEMLTEQYKNVDLTKDQDSKHDLVQDTNGATHNA